MFFNRQERPALVCINDKPAGIPDGMPGHSEPPAHPWKAVCLSCSGPARDAFLPDESLRAGDVARDGECIHPIDMIFRCGTRDSQLTRRKAV
jgi:hypothetical protein